MAIAPPTNIGPDRPLRVHVVGSSVAVFVEPEHGPRDGGTYGEHLVPLLSQRGTPTVVSHAGTWFGRISDALPHYQRDVRDHYPDVLIVNFGVIECQSNVLPTALVRHVTTANRTSRLGAAAYRNKVVPRFWPHLRRYQRWAAARDRERTFRLAPRRFVADVSRLIDLVRKDCGSLVLVLDIDPPGPRLEHWLPGVTARAARYNALLAGIVDSYDDDVRLVRASVTLTDPKGDLPDGLHRSAAGHGLTAGLIAAEITDWLES